MSLFATAMSSSTRTWNNAVSLPNPDPTGTADGRISLFFKSVRGLDVPTQYGYMNKAVRENVIDTFLLTFNTRDCRGGKGERDIGRKGLVWLFINYPEEFEKIISLIPIYGRWDDLLEFFPKVLKLDDILHLAEDYNSEVDKKQLQTLVTLQDSVVSYYADKLTEDLGSLSNGDSVSLAAKWAPTEKDSMDRKYGTYKTLARKMKMSPRTLRKDVLTPLRSYLKIVESYMCNRRWDLIDYSKVPSCAMKKLKKAFDKNDTDRFQEWKQALANGDPKVKVCGKQLFPHELIKEVRMSNSDSVTEAQWNVIVDEVRETGGLESTVAVVDTSSSMHSHDYLPFDVAVAMGMLIAETSVGMFRDHVFTFNDTPEMILLKKGSLVDRWRQVSGISWGGSTNIQATFELILFKGIQCHLTDKDMPKTIVIISDMQFNSASPNGTNFQEIDRKYKDSNFTRPQIVFWNVNGLSSDYPVTVDENGTALISGFSPSIMKTLMTGKEFTPYTIMRETLDSDRLEPVKDALNDGYVSISYENDEKKE